MVKKMLISCHTLSLTGYSKNKTFDYYIIQKSMFNMYVWIFID